MHLQIAAVVIASDQVGSLDREQADDFRAAEESGAQRPPALDLGPTSRRDDGAFDRRRKPVFEDFEDDPGRGRADAVNLRQLAFVDQVREWL